MKAGVSPAEYSECLNVHEGHRDRMRQKFLRFGSSAFEEHELLELLLFGAIPRANVNALAHRLIERFGSLAELFRASPDMIKEVKGAGDQVALLVSIVKELQQYLEPRDNSKAQPLSNPDLWFERLWPYFSGANCEKVYMLSLDSGYRFIDIRELSSGSEKNAIVNLRDLTEYALKSDASYVVLAHNHLNGISEPSKQDIFTTSLVKQLLQSLNIVFLDHILIYDETYKSILYSRARLGF